MGSIAEVLDAYDRRVRAWTMAKSKSPCFECNEIKEIHHATCQAQNLCVDCWEKLGKPCLQVYPGDWGGSVCIG